MFLKKPANGFFCVFSFCVFFLFVLSFLFVLQFTHTISTDDMQHFEHLEPLIC